MIMKIADATGGTVFLDRLVVNAFNCLATPLRISSLPRDAEGNFVLNARKVGAEGGLRAPEFHFANPEDGPITLGLIAIGFVDCDPERDRELRLDEVKRKLVERLSAHPETSSRLFASAIGSSFGGWLSARGLDLSKLKIRVEGEEGEIDLSTMRGRSKLARLISGTRELADFVHGALDGILAHRIFELAEKFSKDAKKKGKR